MIGGKTGYTDSAGYCFVTEARIAGREVVMAFLHADGKHEAIRRLRSRRQAARSLSPVVKEHRAETPSAHGRSRVAADDE